MIVSNRKAIKLLFSIFCSFIVVCMVGYWIYKYKIEDRSIGVVDYVLLREAEDIKLPVVSLCFEHPFSKKKFQDLEVNTTSYLEYLSGEIGGDEYMNIEYQNVTIDLGDYFESASESWYNETDYRDTSLSFDHIVTFNGFWWDFFLKCFSINIKSQKYHYIKELVLRYNKTALMNDWSGYESARYESFDYESFYFYTMHYPGQFLQGFYMSSYNYLDNFQSTWIKEIEVLKRRNSHAKKCIDDSTGYDRRALDQYVSNMGCRLPYITHEGDIPVCQEAKMLMDDRFDYGKIRSMDITPDCEIISKMRIADDDWAGNEDSNSTLRLQLEYPETIRVIHLSKEVDAHSLIGNIGGYLGLFLGNIRNIVIAQQSKS